MDPVLGDLDVVVAKLIEEIGLAQLGNQACSCSAEVLIATRLMQKDGADRKQDIDRLAAARANVADDRVPMLLRA